MTVRELRRQLRRSGCVEVRQSGSHLIVGWADCQSVVPIHGKDVPRGTLRNIERHLRPCVGSQEWMP